MPLTFPGTEFQVRVWSELLRIPCGVTRSYADLARGLGIPGAARAVGRANGQNRIAIVIPCHRMVNAGGQLGGYGGGLRRKEHLLRLEGGSRSLLGRSGLNPGGGTILSGGTDQIRRLLKTRSRLYGRLVPGGESTVSANQTSGDATNRAQRILAKVASRGLTYTGRYAYHSLYSGWWERRMGVTTRGHAATVREDGTTNSENHDYSPSSVLDLKRALRFLPAPALRETFLDLGSGKGRIVLAAAMCDFERVIGVELTPSLHEQAQRNLDVTRNRLKCARVELVCCDAVSYELPEDLSVLYMYNPFGGSVMSRVLSKLRSLTDTRRREVHIVVANPSRFEAAIPSDGWIEKTGSFVGLRKYSIFRATVPAKGGTSGS